MAIPSKGEVLDFSPINRGGSEELPAYRRDAFGELQKALGGGLITAVTGLRRVGKTTLVKQLLGKNSFYYSFDEKRYANPDALKKVIDSFLEEGEKPTIALDEVFRVEDWAGVVKRYHDQKLCRFIVSGSSALLVKKGVESLSGRLAERYLPPLSFKEYLELRGEKPQPVSLQDPFRHKKRFEQQAREFMLNGSFPEIAKSEAQAARDYIKASTVEKIIFDDIPSAFRVEHVSKLYDLACLCANNSAQLFNETGFAEALALSRHAVSDYLLYLQKAYLVDVVYPSGSRQKALKKQKKVFAKTASIYNALAESPNAGQAAETAVYDKLSGGMPSFYRDAQKREVDFIAKYPVEVKYQNAVTTQDSHNMAYYLKKRMQTTGIMVTKDAFDQKDLGGKRLVMMPLDVFLLADVSRPIGGC